MTLLLLMAGCLPAAEYSYGVPMYEVEFELYSTDMGVYPDQSILVAPANPFAKSGVGQETKWDLLEDGPIVGFWAFGTALVAIPTGEHQYYTASQLHAIYDDELAEPDDLVYVRDMAIRGYQAVLDYFPESVTYDATGRYSFPLAPQAIQGIEALGGTVEGGWELVETEDGGWIAVRSE